MPGLYGLSFNPLKRRMAMAADSSIPGFNAIVVSIDRAKRTCDLWVQGSNRVMKGVRYSTALRNPPEYIKVRCPVYVRFPSGSRLAIPEIEGPARAVPTISAGATQFPELEPGPNGVLEGLEVVPWATPGQGVAVNTGKIQFNGIVYSADVVKVGENLNPKATGFTPNVLLAGRGAAVGTTYMSVPLPAPPGAGTYRYDLIEINSALVVNLVSNPSDEAADPPLPAVTAGSTPLAYVLRRPGATVILAEDITLTVASVSGVVILILTSERNPVPYADGVTVLYGDVNPTTITALVKDFNGVPLIGHALEAEILPTNSGTGTLGGVGVIRATGQTDTNGQAIFQYFRTNPNNDATEHSPVIRVRSVTGDAEQTIWLDLRGSTNQSL